MAKGSGNILQSLASHLATASWLQDPSLSCRRGPCCGTLGKTRTNAPRPTGTTSAKQLPVLVGAALTAMTLVSTIWAAPARAEPLLSVGEFNELANRCAGNVSAETLAAVASTESGLNRLAIHDNTTGASPAAEAERDAINLAGRLIGAGHSLDLGLMQINSRNLTRLGLTVDSAFDACRSIAAGAEILSADYDGGATHDAQQAALRVAISRYNSGDAARGFANGYVAQVEQSARRIVPALDVTASPLAAPHALPGPSTAQADPPAAGWEVWPSAPESAGTGGTPSSSPPGKETAILADAGNGDAAPVVTYPPQTEAGNQ